MNFSNHSMGYLGNHLATISTGVFAAVLTGLWPYFVDFAPLLNFHISLWQSQSLWFMVRYMLDISKSTDYMHAHAHASHSEKKKAS